MSGTLLAHRRRLARGLVCVLAAVAACEHRAHVADVARASAACAHRLHDERWGVTLCFPDPYDARPAGGGYVLFGPPTRWPFFDGAHRLALQRADDDDPADATRSDRSTLAAGAWRVERYRVMSRSMQCPAVRFELAGPRATLRAHYPDCGVPDPEFHRETERYVLAVFASAVWDR